jgi:hypothetical protein
MLDKLLEKLKTKYSGLELWVWLLIITILFLGYYLNKKSEKFSENDSSKKSKINVYNYNTAWCGWSRKFQPEWDTFTDLVKNDKEMSHVKTFDVKCDEDTNKTICESVRGFPTVVIDVDNERVEYQAERTGKNLFEYIKSL